VLRVVLVALVPWFAALSAAYRLRLLDRVLGLGELPPVPDRRKAV
jgi:cation-transporting ATPase E